MKPNTGKSALFVRPQYIANLQFQRCCIRQNGIFGKLSGDLRYEPLRLQHWDIQKNKVGSGNSLLPGSACIIHCADLLRFDKSLGSINADKTSSVGSPP